MAHDAGVPYFRLTPSLHADIQLDTVDNNTLIDMMWNTKVKIQLVLFIFISIRSMCARNAQVTCSHC